MRTLVSTAVAAVVIAANGSALAADYKVKAPPPLPPIVQPAPFTWSGCYFGGHTGIATGRTNWKDPTPDGAIDATFSGATAHTDMSGGLYGGQIGCDYQSNNFVVGFEGAFSGSTLEGTNMDQFNSTWALRSKAPWLGSVTGRVGYAVDRALVYARGGAAWTRNQFEIENTAIQDGTPSMTRSGWVVGTGLEWAFAPSWSVFVEGNYFSFGGSNAAFAGDLINPTPAFSARTSQTFETIKFGVNYRMGGF